jgi:hypothetical protein
MYKHNQVLMVSILHEWEITSMMQHKAMPKDPLHSLKHLTFRTWNTTCTYYGTRLCPIWSQMSQISCPVESTTLEGNHKCSLEVSLTLTISEKNANGVLVDFVIINVSRQPHQGDKRHFSGWRITGANIGLLIEVKKFMQRNLEGAEFDCIHKLQISEACKDVINQAVHLFLHDSTRIPCQ